MLGVGNPVSNYTTIAIPRDTAQRLRDVVYKRHGTLAGGVIRDAATAAITAWIEKEES